MDLAKEPCPVAMMSLSMYPTFPLCIGRELSSFLCVLRPLLPYRVVSLCSFSFPFCFISAPPPLTSVLSCLLSSLLSTLTNEARFDLFPVLWLFDPDRSHVFVESSGGFSATPVLSFFPLLDFLPLYLPFCLPFSCL